MLRVNYNLRGVLVPAGEHEVSFVYRPKSVLVGARRLAAHGRRARALVAATAAGVETAQARVALHGRKEQGGVK